MSLPLYAAHPEPALTRQAEAVLHEERDRGGCEPRALEARRGEQHADFGAEVRGDRVEQASKPGECAACGLVEHGVDEQPVVSLGARVEILGERRGGGEGPEGQIGVERGGVVCLGEECFGVLCRLWGRLVELPLRL